MRDFANAARADHLDFGPPFPQARSVPAGLSMDGKRHDASRYRRDIVTGHRARGTGVSDEPGTGVCRPGSSVRVIALCADGLLAREGDLADHAARRSGVSNDAARYHAVAGPSPAQRPDLPGAVRPGQSGRPASHLVGRGSGGRRRRSHTFFLCSMDCFARARNDEPGLFDK